MINNWTNTDQSPLELFTMRFMIESKQSLMTLSVCEDVTHKTSITPRSNAYKGTVSNTNPTLLIANPKFF